MITQIAAFHRYLSEDKRQAEAKTTKSEFNCKNQFLIYSSKLLVLLSSETVLGP